MCQLGEHIFSKNEYFSFSHNPNRFFGVQFSFLSKQMRSHKQTNYKPNFRNQDGFNDFNNGNGGGGGGGGNMNNNRGGNMGGGNRGQRGGGGGPWNNNQQNDGGNFQQNKRRRF